MLGPRNHPDLQLRRTQALHRHLGQPPNEWSSEIHVCSLLFLPFHLHHFIVNFCVCYSQKTNQSNLKIAPGMYHVARKRQYQSVVLRDGLSWYTGGPYQIPLFFGVWLPWDHTKPRPNSLILCCSIMGQSSGSRSQQTSQKNSKREDMKFLGLRVPIILDRS